MHPPRSYSRLTCIPDPSAGLSMVLDPRTPVLVGVGQWSNRVDRGEPPVEPDGMMAEAARRAAADSGAARDLLARADAVRVVSIFSRRYRNAARLVAEQVGAQPRDEAVSPVGGNEPQVLVNQACRDIAAGDARSEEHTSELQSRANLVCR